MSRDELKSFKCPVAQLYVTVAIQSHEISGIGQTPYVQKDYQCLKENACTHAKTELCPVRQRNQ